MPYVQKNGIYLSQHFAPNLVSVGHYQKRATYRQVSSHKEESCMPKQGAQAAHWYQAKYIYKFKGRRRHPKPAA